MKWGSLLLCLMSLGVSMVPWVQGNADLFCLFAAGMNFQAFIDSVERKVDVP